MNGPVPGQISSRNPRIEAESQKAGLTISQILGIGCDILDVDRMEREIAKEDGGFRDSVFTRSEIEYCETKRYPAEHYAARFAAREAVIKALGGVPDEGFSWLDIEISVDDDGAPCMELRGSMKDFADERGIATIHCSLSHTATMAMAYVILEA